MDKRKLIVRIIDQPDPIEIDSTLIFINWKILSDFLTKLKIRKSQIDFIRYLNYDNSWELIGINTPDINVTNLKTLEIMVKLLKKEIPDQNINFMINKAKNICSSIEKEISELKDPHFFKNSLSLNLANHSISQSSSFNLSESSLSEPNSFFKDDKIIDIIVLTANPLLYIEEDKELRVINEFTSITDSIYQAVSKSNIPITSQFLTLTKNNLKYALYKKPKIIHLICQSTYDADNNPQKTYSPILIFENEKCGMEKITKNILTKIFSMYIDNLKDITLFISTPLCEDVYNMLKIKPENKFKNILVQHTTLADVSFMAEFNQELYINLLDKQILYQAFDSSKIGYKNKLGYQFCCCYHLHVDTCPIKMNLSNELFRQKEEQIPEKNKQGNNNKDPLKMIPHVYHLRYQCQCEKKSKKLDFCYHKSNDYLPCENVNIVIPSKKKKIKNNICCCLNEEIKPKQNILHNIDDIFKIDSNEDNKAIFADYDSEEYKYKKCVVLDNDKLPNYGKMQLKVGLNKIFYNSFEFITQKSYNILNFYGNQCNDALEIDNIIDILIEFFKERNSYFFLDKQKFDFNHKDSKPNLNLQLKEKISEKNISKSKLQLSKPPSGVNLDLNLFYQNSAKQLRLDPNFIKPSPTFIILNQENFNSNFSKEKSQNNERRN